MKYVMDGFGTRGVLTCTPPNMRDGNVFFEGSPLVRDAEAAVAITHLVIAVSHPRRRAAPYLQVPNEKIHIVYKASTITLRRLYRSGRSQGRYGMRAGADYLLFCRMTCKV